MGRRDDEDTDTAAARLAQLHLYFREHPVTGPEGHSFTRPPTRPTAVSPGLPYRPDISDHITASVAEVAAHTRAANPDAGPLPPHVEGVYAWAREHTEHAPETVQQRRDTIEYRQRLEHAVAAGDTSVVRPHRCPSCRTLGLHWQAAVQQAMCVNLHCARANGGEHRKWSLAQLAYEQVASEKTVRECAT